jgi:flagellar biogenesis protein FliO
MESLFYFLPTVSQEIDSDSIQFTSQIFRIVGFLGILSVLAFLFTRFYKGKNIVPSSSKSSGKIKIADTHSLGNRQFLVVAEYGCEQHLLGVSPNGIQHLTSLKNAGKVISSPSEDCMDSV